MRVFCLVLLVCGSTFAQTDFPLVISWPDGNLPSVRLTFGKFREAGIANGQGIYVSDVTAQNVSDHTLPRSAFTVFITDKSGRRIGRGLLRFPEMRSKHTEKNQLQFSCTGTPDGLTLVAGKTIPLKVISTPPGANLKVDGQEFGVTPKMVDFMVGTHLLEFSKEGYAAGSTPLEVTADELPGGSISFEMGGLSKDTVELRDGRTLLGDVISMSMTEVVLRIEGKDQSIDRNQIKEIMLVERITTQQPPVAQPVAPQTQ